MKTSYFTEMVDEIIKLKMDIVDEYIEDVIDDIGDIGNPERLIGKKYEEFTPQDFQTLAGIYGENPDSPLNKLIFEKEYKKVLKLEEGL